MKAGRLISTGELRKQCDVAGREPNAICTLALRTAQHAGKRCWHEHRSERRPGDDQRLSCSPMSAAGGGQRGQTARTFAATTELGKPVTPISDLWEQTSPETRFPSIPEWFAAATVEKNSL